MQSKRAELVPIAKVVSRLDGPVAAIRDATPQALHHFTLADQVDQLVSASEAEPDLGFMARLLTLCSLPRTNPGDQHQYTRQNGPCRLILSRTGEYKLPFGPLPRLLMAWLSTEAVRTQSPVISLGDSLSEFMRTLGIYSSDGKAYRRLHDQMDRLFHSSVELTYEHQQVKRFVASHIVVRGEFWWDPKRPNDRSLWDSNIQLGVGPTVVSPGAIWITGAIAGHSYRARNGPYGFTCSQISGVKALRSRGVSLSAHFGCASTAEA